MNDVIDICGSKVNSKVFTSLIHLFTHLFLCCEHLVFWDTSVYIFKAVNYFKLLSLDASETADSATTYKAK